MNLRMEPQQASYNIDSEQQTYLTYFKLFFNQRIETVARRRISRQIEAKFRRLDSLARLLEGNSTCAAVYYDPSTQYLWLANNKIQAHSRIYNEWKQKLYFVFELISNEHLDIDSIFSQLNAVINLNISQEYRRDLKLLNNIPLNLQEKLNDWLHEMYESNDTTKKWQQSKIQTLIEYSNNPSVLNLLEKIIKKTARLVRDFLKLRKFLLSTHHNDVIGQGILNAIKNKQIYVVHTENKDVHAEMRIISQLIINFSSSVPYVGISKLCCDHCAIAMEIFNIPNRGLHGQGVKWVLPSFIKNSPVNLQAYVGNSAYQFFHQLNQTKRNEALAYVESKECNTIKEDARHGRHLYADSSDSDIEFGPNCSDEEILGEIKSFPLADTWTMRHITLCYNEEFQRLIQIGLDAARILTLFKYENTKFLKLASQQFYHFITRLSKQKNQTELSLFEKLSNIFDKDTSLFDSLINDEDELAFRYSLSEVCNRYLAKMTLKACRNSEEASDDSEDDYACVANDIEKDNGWDYDSNSYDSQNYYGFNSSDDDLPCFNPIVEAADINSEIGEDNEFVSAFQNFGL